MCVGFVGDTTPDRDDDRRRSLSAIFLLPGRARVLGGFWVDRNQPHHRNTAVPRSTLRMDRSIEASIDVHVRSRPFERLSEVVADESERMEARNAMMLACGAGAACLLLRAVGNVSIDQSQH